MEMAAGRVLAPGWAVGTLHFYRRSPRKIPRRPASDVTEEELRYERARQKTAAQLDQLLERAVHEVGRLNAESFEMQRRLLDSSDYNEAVLHILKTRRVNAEYAVASAGENFAQMFEQMGDESLRIRSEEIRAVTDRIVEAFADRTPWPDWKEDEVILAAERLTPADVVQLDKTKIRALVLREGSIHSHGAILARSMGIPALAEVDLREEWDGCRAAVRAEKEGALILEPEEQLKRSVQEARRRSQEQKRLLQELKGKSDRTPEGREILLYASIRRPEEVAEVLDCDGAGIGLFRTEFLYLNRQEEPGEEEQFQIYRQAAENMAGRPVYIRAADLGADSRWAGRTTAPEENPALGFRGVRLLLDRQELFRRQLRAVFRAADYGNIGILYPMVTSADELWQIRKIAEAVRTELWAEEIRCPDIPQGIMIETPAAALISDTLAPEVDFFCIAGSELVQYVLAADRQNPRLEAVCDLYHPAVLRLIRTVISAAHRGGCQVSITGEIAEASDMTELLLKMGVDGFFVPPSQILPLRKRIRGEGGE